MTIEVKELRDAERFDVTDRVAGSFGSSEVVVINVGESGVKISHAQPLRIGTKARFWFRRGEITVATQARVVWSHLSKEPQAGGRTLYHSGLHVEQRDPAFAAALQTMLEHGFLRRDLESLERKRKRVEQREREKAGQSTVKKIGSGGHNPLDVTADQALLIEQARSRLRANPQETQRWAARARSAPDTYKHSDEVLAVWESLERTIDLAKLARFMS